MEAGKIGGGVLLAHWRPSCRPVADGMPPPYFQTGNRETEPPRGAIVLPETALHPSQVEALDLIREHRRVALVCGRRWGKSTILITLAVDAALSGKRVGVFAPTRTLMSPLLMEIARGAAVRAGRAINTVLGEIRLPNGGHVDFWSVDHTQRAGRGRKYHLVLIDEAAHDEGYLKDAFPAAIAPTLLDYAGSIVEASTPNGVSPDNHFWQAAHLAELGFVMHHAPTSANPHLPPEEIAALRATMRPEIASQELDALFVAPRGHERSSRSRACSRTASRSPTTGRSTPSASRSTAPPARPESSTTAPRQSSTACVSRASAHGGFDGGEVVILDWDIRALALGSAGAWLRHVNDLYRSWMSKTHPRMGLDGIHIEKPAMGLRLLEIAGEQHIAARELDHPDGWSWARTAAPWRSSRMSPWSGEIRPHRLRQAYGVSRRGLQPRPGADHRFSCVRQEDQ